MSHIILAMAGTAAIAGLIVLVVHAVFGLFPSDDMRIDDLHKQGDLNIGALFSLYKTELGVLCGSQPWDTMVRSAQAMVFMIKTINRDPTLLSNITLGYAILNDCNRQNVALAKATRFIPVDDCIKTGCSDIVPPRNALIVMNSSIGGVSGNIGKPTQKQDPQRLYYDVVGVIASYSSKFAVQCSSLLGVYKIPEISWSATSNELSDKTRYAYFSRVVPPDVYQAKALVSILRQFNWTYISTLHSEGSYGADGIKNVIKFAREEGICVAYSYELAPDETPESYDKVVRSLQKNYKAKAVIMFTLAENAHGIFKALDRANALGQFYFLGSDGFAFDDLKDVREMAVNSLYIDLVTSSSAEFERFYTSLNPWNQVSNGNPWEGQYITEYIGCSWDLPRSQPGSCNAYSNITDFPDFPFGQSPTGVMDAIKTFAIALNNLIEENCPGAKSNKRLLQSCVNGPRLLGYIRKVKFVGASGGIELDENGDLLGGYNIKHVRPVDGEGMVMTRVGYWSRQDGQLTLDEPALRWFTSSNDTPILDTEQPESVCAKPCVPGEFYVRGELACCWECRRCRNNEKVSINGYGCDICPENKWPDQETFNTCQLIPPTYMNWVDPIGLGLVAMAAVGLVTVAILINIFSKYRNKKVIKGSSVELMIFIKVGLLLAYATVFAFIAKAETWSCYTNYFGFNLSCTFIFGPLFIKTNRLYRIFAASESLKQRIRMVDATSQIVFIVLIIVIQAAITTVTAILYPPAAIMKMPVITDRFVELLCTLPLQNLVIPLSYNLLLLLLCAVFGFLTRKLPDNFNESWYIFISVMTTLFVWIAFLPTYFVAFYAYHKAALLALALILNGAVTSLCLFTPKIYALYYVDDKNIKVTNYEASEFDGPSNNTESTHAEPRADKKSEMPLGGAGMDLGHL